MARTSRDGATVFPGLCHQAGHHPSGTGRATIHSQNAVDTPRQDKRLAVNRLESQTTIRERPTVTATHQQPVDAADQAQLIITGTSRMTS